LIFNFTFGNPEMQKRVLLNSKHVEITISRLCQQLIETHNDFSDSAIIGLQPRGVFVANRIHQRLSEILNGKKILLGSLDVTFHRDDYRRRDIVIPSETKLDFIIEDKKVILVDDVLYTGRTIRAGMDALLDFGRAAKIELLTLIDRRYSRHLPIEPNYIGIQVDTIMSEKVKVQWKETDGEDAIWLITENN
jgi:pyrimidine operon attenuation protein/uracil phosphoribosyltransferase